MALEKTGLHAVITGMGAFQSAGREIDRTYDRLTTGSERAASRMSRLGDIAKTAIGFAVGQVALGAIKSFTGGIANMIASAAPLVDMENAFKRLAASYDIGADSMIEAMRAASKGTIADSDLIQSANKALIGSGQDLGKQFGEALPKLLEMARASAKATGQDVGFLFESLVTGIKRGSPMIIDNTGLQLKLSEAYEATAAKIGIAVEEMTAEQKQIALLNATLEAGRSMVEAMGDEQLTTAELMAQMRAQMKNLRNEIGKAFVPLMAKLLKRYLIPFGKLLIKTIVPWTKRFARGLDIVADAIDAFISLDPGAFPWEDVLPEPLADLAYRISDAFDFLYERVMEFRRGFDWAIQGGDRFWAILVGLGEALDDVLPERVMNRIWDFIFMIQRGKEAIVGLPQAIRDALSSPTAMSAINTLKEAWRRLREEGIGALPSVIDDVREKLSVTLAPTLERTRARLDAWVDGIVEWLGEQPERIAAAIADWGTRIQKWLDVHAPGKELTYEQMGFLTAPAEDVEREMRPWWQSIADTIVIGWDQVIKTVEAKAREYQRRFSDALWGWLQVEERWEDASALGPRYVSRILEQLEGWITRIAEWLGEVGVPTIFKALEGLAVGIIRAVFHFGREEQDEVQRQLTPLEEAIYEGFKDIGKAAVDGFKAGFEEAWVKPIFVEAGIQIAEEPLEDMLAKTIEETGRPRNIAKILRAWKNVFKDVFGKGPPKDLLKDAKDYGSELGESVIEGTEDILQIHSASKVYERIGKEMAEGMADGLQSSWSIWRVTDALLRLVGESRYQALPIIQHLAEHTGHQFAERTAAGIRDRLYELANAMLWTWTQATRIALDAYEPPILPAPIIPPPEPPTPPAPPGPYDGYDPTIPPGYQFGGVVPGPRGDPRWAVVHGGEIIVNPSREQVPAMVKNNIIYNITNYGPTWSPTVQASYLEQQDPGSVAGDLETLAILYRMGP